MPITHQFQFGNFQCWAINDGEFAGTAEMLFANAPAGKLQHVLQRYGLEADHLPSTWTCLLVKTAANLVLIDTGFGSGGSYGGWLLPALRATGFSPDDIDTVILTHAHADHIGGGVDEAGSPTFPQATYYMSRNEWDFWTTAANLAKVPEWAAETARRKLPSLRSRLETVDQETEIVPGISTIEASGHTIGHIAVEIRTQGKQLFYLADVALHPIQVEYPDWYSRLDQFPEKTVATRRSIYSRAARANAAVLFFHFPPFPSMGRIITRGRGWTWQPLRD